MLERTLNDASLPPLIEAALGCLCENYAQFYGVEELAEELGVSKCHLIRAFERAVGIPPGRYLTLLRIEAAKGLLCHRALSLEAVAGLCGFSGANYLCRVFKRETGETPRGYRMRHAPAKQPDAVLQEQIDRLYL